MVGRPFVVFLMGLSLLAAGCLGGAKPQATDVADTSLAAEASNTLLGFVLTTDSLPVAEATVRVDGVEEARVTNAQGGYKFVDLPPGEHAVRVEKEGFRPGVERASIRDGYATIVNVTLEAAAPTTWHETLPFSGMLSCHFSAGEDPETGTNHDCNSADPNARPSHEFTVQPGAAQVQIEIFWTQATVAARNLTTRIETVDLGALNVVFAHYAGESGMKITIGEANLDKYLGQGGKVRVSMSSGPSARVDPVPIGVGLALQQQYDVAFTVFYGEAGPADFSYRAT